MVIDGKHYRDVVEITTDQFWGMFNDLKEQPSTTAVSPGDFLDTFTELSKSTDTIVCILVAKTLSATQESAYLAKRMLKSELPDLNIEIIDSKTAVGAMGFIVLEAARAAQQNKDMAEVIKVARDMIPRVLYLGALDSLKYLINIGRAPKATSIGEFFKLKPVVGFVDDSGHLNIVARVRGNNKALTKVVDLVEKYIDTSRPIHAMVHYCNGIETGNRLKEMVTSRYDCAEIYVTQYSPVVVSSTGPNIGLSFYS